MKFYYCNNCGHEFESEIEVLKCPKCEKSDKLSFADLPTRKF